MEAEIGQWVYKPTKVRLWATPKSWERLGTAPPSQPQKEPACGHLTSDFKMRNPVMALGN
jgi:hypothetical protein